MTSLEPKHDDRYLILAPHPDDETLAAGGLIQGAVKAGARVKIVYLTNGENNFISALFYYRTLFLKKSDFEGLGQVRRREALDAARALGLKEEDLCFLGYPDLGMFPMRNTSQGARVISDLLNILRHEAPTHIIFPDARDGHADHRAVFLYLEEALRNTELSQKPHLLSYCVHGILKNKPVRGGEAVYQLIGDERESKRRATLCYASQTAYRKGFLLSFATPIEKFVLSKSAGSNGLILRSIAGNINRSFDSLSGKHLHEK